MDLFMFMVDCTLGLVKPKWLVYISVRTGRILQGQNYDPLGPPYKSLSVTHKFSTLTNPGTFDFQWIFPLNEMYVCLLAAIHTESVSVNIFSWLSVSKSTESEFGFSCCHIHSPIIPPPSHLFSWQLIEKIYTIHSLEAQAVQVGPWNMAADWLIKKENPIYPSTFHILRPIWYAWFNTKF